MEPIRIVIADAHFLIREGLKNLFEREPDIELVGEAIQEAQLFSLLKTHHPNVLIIDYDQAGKFSSETVKQILNRFPEVNILIISANDKREEIYDLLENKVNSYLTKECDQREIIDAVKATARGEKFFCTKVLNYLLEKSFSDKENCAPTPLSPREVEIVRLVAEGKIAKEIASTLDLSTHTVYTHRKNIMRKLQLSSSSELVLYAVQNGLVSQNAKA